MYLPFRASVPAFFPIGIIDGVFWSDDEWLPRRRWIGRWMSRPERVGKKGFRSADTVTNTLTVATTRPNQQGRLAEAWQLRRLARVRATWPFRTQLPKLVTNLTSGVFRKWCAETVGGKSPVWCIKGTSEEQKLFFKDRRHFLSQFFTKNVSQ